MLDTVITLILKYKEGLVGGLRVTLALAGISWAFGIVLGVLFGALADRSRAGVGLVLSSLGFVLSGIPVIVLLFWAHFPLQSYLEKVVDPFFTAALVLSLINVVAVGQIVSSVLREFPQQYVTAAKVCGLSARTIFFEIKLPIVFRLLVPPVLMSQVGILQATLFSSLISVEELFRVCQRINGTEYKPVEIYTALAVFFLAICLPLNGLALWLKKRYGTTLSER